MIAQISGCALDLSVGQPPEPRRRFCVGHTTNQQGVFKCSNQCKPPSCRATTSRKLTNSSGDQTEHRSSKGRSSPCDSWVTISTISQLQFLLFAGLVPLNLCWSSIFLARGQVAGCNGQELQVMVKHMPSKYPHILWTCFFFFRAHA